MCSASRRVSAVPSPGIRTDSIGRSDRWPPSRSGSPLTPRRRENGCMQYIPGSHRERKLYRHLDSDSTDLVLNQVLDMSQFAEADKRDVILEPGRFAMFDVYLVHGSNPNPVGQAAGAGLCDAAICRAPRYTTEPCRSDKALTSAHLISPRDRSGCSAARTGPDKTTSRWGIRICSRARNEIPWIGTNAIHGLSEAVWRDVKSSRFHAFGARKPTRERKRS